MTLFQKENKPVILVENFVKQTAPHQLVLVALTDKTRLKCIHNSFLYNPFATFSTILIFPVLGRQQQHAAYSCKINQLKTQVSTHGHHMRTDIQLLFYDY